MPWDFDFSSRLWPRVNIVDSNACWEWQGSKTAAGYGLLTIKYKNYYAHILAWELSNNQKAPKGSHICHTCDNPSCCNPKHLFLGNAKINRQDAIEKGRDVRGEQHTSAKLTSGNVLEIRELAKQGISHSEIARRFKVSRGAIVDIIYRRTWTHI